MNEIQKHSEFKNVKILVDKYKSSNKESIMDDFTSGYSLQDSDKLISIKKIPAPKRLWGKNKITQELKKIIRSKCVSKFHESWVQDKRPMTFNAYKGVRHHRNSVT